MSGCWTWIAPSLLALAVASAAAGCGDDASDDGVLADGGQDSGYAGRPAAGRGGNGGRGGSDAGPTMAECVAKSAPSTMGKVDAECVSCACEFGAAQAFACDATCWSLFDCFSRECADVDIRDMNASAGCALTHCEPFVAGLDVEMALRLITQTSCASPCAESVPADAGFDAGE
jgi:hypothetical protein